MKIQNDSAGNRRNIPTEFMDYIAQTFGYPDVSAVPEEKAGVLMGTIKERFCQLAAIVRRPYRDAIKLYKRENESPLDFAKRVENYLKTSNDEKE